MKPPEAKGNRVNIPDPAHGDFVSSQGEAPCGNAIKLGDAGGGFGKSSLFFV